MLGEYYVYAHKRLDTDAIFYVGKGKGNRAYRKYGRNVHWTNIVNKVGHEVLIITCNVTEEEAFVQEINLIKELREQGVSLCNMTEGGEGSSGLLHTDEQKTKISAALLGKAKPESQKQKLSALLSSGNHPIFSEAAREKNKGENHWAYGLTGEDNPSYGRKDTPEMIEAKRQRMLGRKTGPCTEERREAIRKATAGVKKSTTENMKKPKVKRECLICGKMVDPGNLSRWHGEGKCSEVLNACT